MNLVILSKIVLICVVTFSQSYIRKFKKDNKATKTFDYYISELIKCCIIYPIVVSMNGIHLRPMLIRTNQ